MSWIVFHWLEFLKVLAVYLPIFAILYFSLRKKENAFWWFYGIASFIILTINFGGYFVLYFLNIGLNRYSEIFFDFAYYSLAIVPFIFILILFLTKKQRSIRFITLSLLLSLLISLVNFIGFLYFIAVSAASINKF